MNPNAEPILFVFLLIILISGFVCMRISRKRHSNKPMYIYGIAVVIACIPMFLLTR